MLRNISLVFGLTVTFSLGACVLEEEPLDDFEGELGTDTRDRADRDRPERPELILCRSDRDCPRGSYCEPGLDACFTSSRCYVNGRPSDELCEREYGEGFVCYEYAPGSHHCMPTAP